MRKIIFLFIFVFACTVCSSQNLVPNPSFELYDTCPNSQAQIRYATGWENWKYTPDYFNFCSSNFSVPHNWGGYQEAATGNAYAGIYTYENADTNVREIIAHSLISNLVIGVKYYVSFKVSLAYDTNLIFNQATNNLGVLFSTISYNQFNPIPIKNNATIYSASVITDTANWTVINGSFIADSAYQYIAIGNFFNDANTTVVQTQDTAFDKAAYYFIDDVCVSTDSAICDFATNIASEATYWDKMKIFPNPFNSSCIVYIPSLASRNEPSTIVVTDLYGVKIREESAYFYNGRYVFERNNIKEGIYILQIKNRNKMFTQKIILTN